MRSRKTLKSVVAIAVLMLAVVAGTGICAADTGGTCGGGLTWSVDENEHLTITYDGTGTGVMDDYDNCGPWGTEITSLSLPEGLKNIGNSAFHDCTKLIGSLVLPESLTSIGIDAFYDCSGFTGSLSIPNNVTSIDIKAFLGCSGFSGTLSLPSKLSSLGYGAFDGCSGLTGTLTFPEDITLIGERTFAGCNHFTGSVIIPSGVTSIGADAFINCSGFDGTLTLPQNLISIGEGAFYGCTGFTGSLILPSHITSIGNKAFFNCVGFIGSLTIPVSIINIGTSAFDGCNSITCVMLPSGISSIEEYTFCNLSDNTIIYTIGTAEVPSSSYSTDKTAVSKKNGDDSYKFTVDASHFPTGVSLTNANSPVKPGYIFEGWYPTSACTGDEVISANNNDVLYAKWSENAGTKHTVSFSGDEHGIVGATTGVYLINNGSNVHDGLEVVFKVTPESGYLLSAFTVNGIDKKSEVISGTYIVNSLSEDITVSATFSSDKSCGDGLTWSVDENKHLTITYDGVGSGIMDDYTQSSCSGPWGQQITSISLPDGLKHIGNLAFQGCQNATGILAIPSSVTSIGDQAFSGCGFTGSVTISSNITTIGDEAFCRCGLQAITVDSSNPSYKDIDGVLFSKDGTLLICCPSGKIASSYNFPESVTKIGQSAFIGCSEVTGSLIIPSHVVSIGDDAFIGSGFSGELIISSGVKTIGDSVFYQCFGPFNNLTIPDSVTSIGQFAFSGCGITGDITIGSGVDNIGDSSFLFCGSCQNIFVDSGNQNYKDINGVLFSKDGTKLICFPNGKIAKSYTIPDSVTTICNRAFGGCSDLTSVTVSSSVTTIGTQAFNNIDSNSVIYAECPVSLLSGNYSTNRTALAESGANNAYTFTVDTTSFPSGFPLTSANAPVKDNNTFEGWYTSLNPLSEKVTTVTDGQTLYANWVDAYPITTITVSDLFDPDVGTYPDTEATVVCMDSSYQECEASVSSIQWSDVGGSPVTGTFEENKQYRVVLTVNAPAGRTFDQNISFSKTSKLRGATVVRESDSQITITNTYPVSQSFDSLVFTSELDTMNHHLGDNVLLNGTINRDIPLYMSFEGTNTPFQCLVCEYSVSDGSWNIKIGRDSFPYQQMYPGTYTLYVSPVEWDKNNTAQGHTKMDVLTKSTPRAIIFLEPEIAITYLTGEVEKGISQSTGEGNFITALIDAPGTDSLAFYIIGQNKMFHIGGENGEAVDSKYVKNLSTEDTEHYLYSTDASNIYAYQGIDTDKSLTKIAKKLGAGTYPLYLILDNEDGTFTLFVHIQKSGETTERIGTYPEEAKNNTEFDYGQYYFTAQHPMVDKTYNTWATNDMSGTAYSTGTNIYTNGQLMYNVPAIANKDAANNLIICINNGGDKQASASFYCVAEASDKPVISEVKDVYSRGDIIKIVISGYELETIYGFIESSDFDYDSENLGYIQSFAGSTQVIGDLSILTLTLDTTQAPSGNYNIVLRYEDNTIFKVYDTKIVGGPSDPGTVVIGGASTIRVGETTTLTAVMSDGSVGNFSWTTSDGSIASVSNTGLVTGISNGTVSITATDANTGESASKTVTVYTNGSGFKQVSSELSATGTVVPNQPVTGTVVFSFDVRNLMVGDTISVQTTFEPPWEATIEVVGDDLRYSDTVNNKRQSMDCINILNIASKATVTVSCTGIIPEAAKGCKLVPLTVTVKSSNASESGVAQTSSLDVYNTDNLTTDMASLTSRITELTSKANECQQKGLDVTVPLGYLSEAQTLLSYAQRQMEGEYASSRYYISALEKTNLAEKSLDDIIKSQIFTVTFVTEHGDAPAAQSVRYGETATDPGELTCPGYVFGGWYSDSACTIPYGFSTPVTANLTLYARWTGGESISVSTDKINFGTEINGYTVPDEKQVTITNNTASGTVTVSASSQNFTYSGLGSIPAGQSSVVYVQPVSGLSAGEYSDVISVRYTAGSSLVNKEISVTFSVIKTPGKAEETVIPDLPEIAVKTDATGKTSSVEAASGFITTSGTEPGEQTATIQKSASGVKLVITNATVAVSGDKTKIELTSQSEISAVYPETSADNKQKAAESTYALDIGMKSADSNLPVISGEYNFKVAKKVEEMGYTAEYMISATNTDVSAINENVSTVTPKFTVSTGNLPADRSKVKIIHTSESKSGSEYADILTPTFSEQGSGKTTVSATSTHGFSSYILCYETEEPEPVTGIVVEGASELYAGSSTQLTATVTPSSATIKTIIWSSSNTSVATVDSTGKVTALKAGTVTITAAASDGSGVSGSRNMTVLNKEYTVSFAGDSQGTVTAAADKSPISSGSQVSSGSSVVFTMTPDDGYRLKTFTVNGTDRTSKAVSGTYAIESLSENTSVAATFESIPVATYTVTFSTVYGTRPAAQYIADGQKATDPGKLFESGYVFGGWYSDKACTVPYGFSTPVTGDLTLYAKWTDGDFTVSTSNITFDTSYLGGTVPDERVVTVTNLSDSVLVVSASSPDFKYSGLGEIPAEKSTEIRIQPASTSTIGEYSDTILIRFKDSLSTVEKTVSVNFSVVEELPHKEEVIVKPEVPSIDTKTDDTTGKTTEVETASETVTTSGTVPGEQTATIQKDDSSVKIEITNATVAVSEEETKVELTDDSTITAVYPETIAENKQEVQEAAYTLDVELETVDSYLPTVSGEFETSVSKKIEDMGYTVEYMISTTNTDVSAINENVKSVTVSFIVANDKIPADRSRVKIVHTSTDNDPEEFTEILTPTFTKKDENTTIVSATSERGFSAFGFVLDAANMVASGGETSTTFFGRYQGDNTYQFERAVVVTELIVPDGFDRSQSVSYTHKESGMPDDGYYQFTLSAPGYNKGETGMLSFQVLLGDLGVKGYDTHDIILKKGDAELPTWFLYEDGKYVYYLSEITDAGTYVISFVRGGSEELPIQNVSSEPGYLNIRSTPQHAAITINGVSYGETPQTGIELDPGTYAIKLELDWYNPYVETVTITAGETLDFYQRMEQTDERKEAAKTPFPLIGVLAGLGVAGVLALRRR